MTQAIKCIVWDLDNTLWHGVLSENDELVLRDNIPAILETLDERGILLSIASKNTHDDAWKTLERFGLAEYFLYPQINWGPKSQSLTRICEQLNIASNAIAFIDDQPFERDEVAFAHPDVLCLDVDAIADLLTKQEFIPRFITGESGKRRMMYRQDQLRKEEEQRIDNNAEFLASLSMEFFLSPASVEDLQRVEELTVRTNQLNATGYAYSYDELRGFLESPRHTLLVAELVDKYGSYGKIGVALIERESDVWTLKLMLMSCRVMARGVGSVMLQYIVNQAYENGARIEAEFLPTDRNRVMYITYKFAGFREVGALPNNGIKLGHPADRSGAYPEYLVVRTPSDLALHVS